MFFPRKEQIPNFTNLINLDLLDYQQVIDYYGLVSIEYVTYWKLLDIIILICFKNLIYAIGDNLLL